MNRIYYKNYNFSGIYGIKNIINKKTYVGSAVNIKKRWKQHISSLNIHRHRNRHLQRAWNKYGQNYFKFIVIERCDKNILLIREQIFIDKFKSANPKFGYNIHFLAKSPLGIKRSKKFKEKCRKRAFQYLAGYWKNKKFSNEHKKHIGLKSIGRNLNRHFGCIELLFPYKFENYQFHKRYRARIWHNKRRWNLGCFNKKYDAYKTLMKANKLRKIIGDTKFAQYVFAVSENNKNKKSNKIRVVINTSL